MSDFGPAFNFVIDHEDAHRLGTITRDEGGVTKWGISSRAFPDVDVPALSLKDALKIGFERIWTPGGFEHLDAQGVANHVFDRAWNCGTRPAVTVLQRALNTLGAALTIDGVLGDKTAGKANAVPPAVLLPELYHESVMFYGKLVCENPGRLGELLSFLNRATAA